MMAEIVPEPEAVGVTAALESPVQMGMATQVAPMNLRGCATDEDGKRATLFLQRYDDAPTYVWRLSPKQAKNASCHMHTACYRHVPCVAGLFFPLAYPLCIKWDIDPDIAEAKGQLFILGESCHTTRRNGRGRALYRLLDEGVEKKIDERKQSGEVVLTQIKFPTEDEEKPEKKEEEKDETRAHGENDKASRKYALTSWKNDPCDDPCEAGFGLCPAPNLIHLPSMKGPAAK